MTNRDHNDLALGHRSSASEPKPAETGLMAKLRRDFPILNSLVYLNTAAEGLIPEPCVAALEEYAIAKRRGELGRPLMYDAERDCRALAAAMLNADPSEIGLIASVSRGVGAVVSAIDWRPGDNIVTADVEFRTNLAAAVQMRGRGVEARVVGTSREGRHAVDIAAAVSGRTRLILVSLVSSYDGHRLDLAPIMTAARDCGALLFVDATQALGAIDIEPLDADFVAASTYKWVLSSPGLAVMYVNRRCSLEPSFVSYKSVRDVYAEDRLDVNCVWDDARRFEEGMLTYPSVFLLRRTLIYMEVAGIRTVQASVRHLTAQAIEGLTKLGVDLLTPRADDRRAGIVSFKHSRYLWLRQSLLRRRIAVWGKDGRIRISPHFYNSSEDIDYFLREFATLKSRATG